MLLGDNDTAGQRDRLAEHAAERGGCIVDVFGFSPNEPASGDDLTTVEAVVAALGRAIADRADIWVPYPGPDLGSEQHWRRLSLVLQRHGLNLRLGRDLDPCPTTGGSSEIDFALRREVQYVDALDHAALAAVGVESLGREIELALSTAGADVPETSRPAPRAEAGSGHGAPRVWPPVLPPSAAAWRQRRPALKRYASWLVNGCGVTYVATARMLNSAGQRTATGRRWQPATVSKLLNGAQDRATQPARPRARRLVAGLDVGDSRGRVGAADAAKGHGAAGQ
jgi:hypothetical protein